MSDDRARLLEWIDQDRDKLVAFFSGFTQAPSPNPPGDTRAAADFVCRFLDSEHLPYRIVAAKPEMPNIVGSFSGAAPGRHLVLNGHIDVFPAGPAAGWAHPPWSGKVADGHVHGRGTVDMKCGTTASVFAFTYLYRLRDRLKGRLTLTAVSDEETGGHYGSRHLMEHFGDEVRGDCCLNGEPGGPETIRFGEKGTLRAVFKVHTPGAHGAYPHLSANAIRIMGRIMNDLDALGDWRHPAPPQVTASLDAGREVIDRVMGNGAADIVGRITVNFGVIQGGLKINMLPGDCRLEVDLRIPVGLDSNEVRRRLVAVAGRYPEASIEELMHHSSPSSWSDPGHEMVRILQRIVASLGGFEPKPVVSIGASDCKVWRQAGVPSYIYGCSPSGMASPRERVSIDEFLHVVRTHTLAAHAYLTA
ncbi:MAG: M20/M25/M40 family metallo-hydrolase [Proteobacteria bacterium]|nr:M20/M25/M40 family metallo-hydrolase [Pseudomonadota bacterium]